MDAANKSRIGIIILAAGSSSRLGNPKQLLKFQNETLIRRAAQTALAGGCKNVAVVLGANAAGIKKEIEDLPVGIIINENWQSGMSSTIKTGLEKLLEDNLSAVILMLCDQPFVSAETILRLIKTQKETRKKIVVSEYEESVGVPAIFSSEMFGELINLQGEMGAKFLIKKYSPSEVAKISAPEAAFDVDTSEDYERLKESAK